MITSLMILSAMEALRATTAMKQEVSTRTRALAFAQELLSEAVSMAYEEPTGAVSFGVEANDSGAGRTGYDDVDDYAGYSESPPRDVAGNNYANAENWTRAVSVSWVNAADPGTASGSETGYKRIEVIASFQGREILRLSALRTREAP